MANRKRKSFIDMVESELNDSVSLEEFKLKFQELKLVFTCADSVKLEPAHIRVDQPLTPSLTT